MSSQIITKVNEEMNDLPDDLQQQVLKFVVTLQQQHLQTSGDAWDVLELLTVTVEAPAIGQQSMITTSMARLNARKPIHEALV